MTYTEENYNLDSNALMGIFSLLSGINNLNWNKSGVIDTGSEYLNDAELNELFRTNKIIKKIIIKYPEEAKAVGYQIKDSKGKIVFENDELILEAFQDASIYARLYGKAYLIFDTEKKDFDKPLKFDEKLTGYRIERILNKYNDYFLSGMSRVHESYVLIFIGSKNYVFGIDINNEEYSDSIIQSLYGSLFNYVNASKYVKYILENISYLRIGIKALGTKLRNEAGKKEVFERLQSVNANRDATRILAYDSDNENIDFLSQSLAGLPEVVKELKDLFVCESEYPYDVLFEDSQHNGLSSGAQNQLVMRFLWAKRVRTWILNNWVKNYKTLFSRLHKQFQDGSYTLDIPFEIETTQDEQADLENKIADRNNKLITTGVITVDEARTTYRGNKFNLNLELNEEAFQKQKQSSLEGKQPEQEQQQVEENQKDGKLSDLNKDALSDEEYDELAEVTFDDIESLELDAKKARTGGYVRDENGRFARTGRSKAPGLKASDIGSQNAMLKSGKIGSNTSKKELELIAVTLGIKTPPKATKEDIKELIRKSPRGSEFINEKKTTAKKTTEKKTETPTAKSSKKITSATKKEELISIAKELNIEVPLKAKKEDIKELIRKNEKGADYFTTSRKKKTNDTVEEVSKNTKKTTKKTTIAAKENNDDDFETLLKKTDTNTEDYKQFIKLGEFLTNKYINPDVIEKETSEKISSLTKKADEIADKLDYYADNQGKVITLPNGQKTRVTKKMVDDVRNEYWDNDKKIKEVQDSIEVSKKAQHESLKNELIARGLSKAEAFKLFDKIDTSKLPSEQIKEAREGIAMLYSISGGKGQDSIKFLTKESDRPFANYYESKINVGIGDRQLTLHEAAHHMEYESPGIMVAANEWRNSRATSTKPVKLKILSNNEGYDDSEVALPDKFLRPYVGKVYNRSIAFIPGKDKSIQPSEVVSMGVEHFVSTKGMKILYEADKEHYNLIVGMLLAKRKPPKYIVDDEDDTELEF